MSASMRRVHTRRIAIMGMLTAIVLILTYTPLGFIQIGPIAATLIHLPVLIAVMAEGLGVGLGMGLVFGLSSMLRAYTTPTVTSFIFMNPLIAVFPRLLVPVVAWAVAKACEGIFARHSKKELLAWGIGSFVGTLMNTVSVLGLIYIVYGAEYAAAIGVAEAVVPSVIATVALTNGLPEAVLATIIVPAVMTGLSRIYKRI